MSDVSVVGTGAMGSALASALATSGASVTVWNRSRDKAEELSGPTVRVAGSVVEAFASSPLVLVAVSDHEVGRVLVDEARTELAGTVVASTSFVTPEQGQAFAAAVSEAGGTYLDLAIPAYPSEVRSGAGRYFVSGDQAAYEAHRERFEGIGRASYVDGAPGSAYVSEMAVLLAYLPMAVGLLQGLRICELHDLPTTWFEETVLDLYPFHIRSLLDRATAASPSASDVEASVDVWRDGAAEYATYLGDLGLDTRVYDALHQLFSDASEAGDGDLDWIRIAEYAAAR